MDTVLKNFKNNGFDAVFVKNRKEALQAILDRIPQGSTVGGGDSATLMEIGVFRELRKRNFVTYYPFDEEMPIEKRREINRLGRMADIFLSGSNAITVDGKIVNVDANGNRVTGMIFGPKRAIIVVGTNKIVKNVEEALKKIRTFTAPLNAKRLGQSHGSGVPPCVETGRCVDCDSPRRICNVTTIIEKKPRSIDISVIIVGETLGI